MDQKSMQKQIDKLSFDNELLRQQCEVYARTLRPEPQQENLSQIALLQQQLIQSKQRQLQLESENVQLRQELQKLREQNLQASGVEELAAQEQMIFDLSQQQSVSSDRIAQLERQLALKDSLLRSSQLQGTPVPAAVCESSPESSSSSELNFDYSQHASVGGSDDSDGPSRKQHRPSRK